MHILLTLGITSFLFCLILTPLCSKLALRLNLVDHPDADRKLHIAPVPRIGGVPIVIAYVGALVLVSMLHPWGEHLHIQHHSVILSLLPAAGVIFLTGLLDDLFGLKPWQKLTGQFAGALLAVQLGTRIVPASLGVAGRHSLISSSWVDVPLSVLWIVGCTNAVNLIDGLDGLASGVGLFVSIATLVAGLVTGNAGLVVATVPLVGCLLAFLHYNFNPASIFLGDCGSLTIGFMLGCFALVWGQHTGTLLGMTAPLMALALPIIDVLLAICRRYLRRVPIFKADRGHIHHMVLNRGFKPHQATLLLYAACAIAGSLALLQSFALVYFRAAIVLVFITLVFVGIRYLDYIELGAARRVLLQSGILRIVREEIYLHDLEHSLVKAVTAEDSWNVVKAMCAEMQFTSASMYFRNTYFETTFSAAVLPFAWTVKLPLGERGYINLIYTGKRNPPRLTMSALERTQAILATKELSSASNVITLSGAA